MFARSESGWDLNYVRLAAIDLLGYGRDAFRGEFRQASLLRDVEDDCNPISHLSLLRLVADGDLIDVILLLELTSSSF